MAHFSQVVYPPQILLKEEKNVEKVEKKTFFLEGGLIANVKLHFFLP